MKGRKINRNKLKLQSEKNKDNPNLSNSQNWQLGKIEDTVDERTNFWDRFGHFGDIIFLGQNNLKYFSGL